MTKPRAKDPFEVRLSPDKELALTEQLCDALQYANDARELVSGDNGLLDFAYALYEQQADPRGAANNPGGVDLTSPIGTQMVDALAARATKTIMVDPVWIAEGYGEDAKKAGAVEEGMQWRLEEMRGQTELAKGFRQSFIEEGAIVEVCEDAMDVTHVKTIKAKVRRADDGNILIDGETGQPLPMFGEDGTPVQADDLEEFVECAYRDVETMRGGASLRLHSLKDFRFLPGHARDRRDVWAHATRFWRTLDEIEQAVERKDYRDVLDQLGGHHERDARAENQRSGTDVQVDHGSKKVEKELWTIQFYADLGGKKGTCFYIATISLQHRVILRLKHDWIGRFRTVYLNPYPRNYNVYGYSLILHKLLTTIEGHTAWRNMNAVRGMLKSNAPYKRLHGALWDPRIQTIGPGQAVDVNDMREIEPFPFDDVTAHAFTREREFYEEATRIVGISDIAVSVNPKQARTLGENEMVTEQSFVRMEDPIRNLQEAMEDIGELIHAIEGKRLEELEATQPRGAMLPGSLASSLALRQAPDNGVPEDDVMLTFTAEMWRGRYRFKPRGSVESADPKQRVNKFMSDLGVAKQIAEVVPAFAARLQTPEIADALAQQFVDVVKPRDKQAWLKPLPPPMPMAPPGMPPPGPGAGGPAFGPPSGAPQFGGQQLIDQMIGQMPQGVQ